MIKIKNDQVWGPWAKKIAAHLAPLALLLVVIGLESLNGTDVFVSELAVAVPFLAAALVGPRVTAFYALAAVTVAVAVLLGFQRDPDDDGGFVGYVGVQLIRVTPIMLGGVLAIYMSHIREAVLRSVTHVAAVAQRAILSDPPSTIGSVRIAVSSMSAASDARVGGDLYEVMDSPYGVRLIIGDVRGRGLNAVYLASRVLGCFRVDARRLDDIISLIADLDAEVATHGGPEDFVTAVVAQIDSAGHAVLANAGHPDPVLITSTRADLVSGTERHPPLGLALRVSGPTKCLRLTLTPGDLLFFYTDGLAEARRPGTREFFPVLSTARTSFTTTTSLDNGVIRLLSELSQWTRKRFDDDVALLAVQFDPSSDLPPALPCSGRTVDHITHTITRRPDDE